ncbi:hypothetical protein K3495_g3526 [Podosphaera aphanis]|nr:hypothetical protein K3495_g3526 [Podosphaera aphanis]
MSHLANSLVTVDQLYERNVHNDLPSEIQESIRYYTARLTQAAGILLRLPQGITAQANVLLFRYWTVDPLMEHEFSEVSAATIFLTAKISASPRSLRSITNVYAYLLAPHPTTAAAPSDTLDGAHYYVSEATLAARSARIIHLEGQILNALGFTVHVALPHPLAITYLQALDMFTDADSPVGSRVAHRTIAHLNAALLSPQMLYLTHQPYQLATAAIYLAARELGVALPTCPWWEVFDCEREDLGFLVVAFSSLESIIVREQRRWGEDKSMITRKDISSELEICRWNTGSNVTTSTDEDEEEEMAKLLDHKVAAAQL